MTSPLDSSSAGKAFPITLILRGLLVGWLILSGVWYAVTTLVSIANFAWPQLAFDQFRSYTYYLGMPFPANVLILENGHRPIIPASFRILEIHAFAANQYLQIALGTLYATLAATIVAVTAWRDRLSDAPVRAAGVLFALVGIFWLGNARMLLHGNESSGIYLVVLCVVAGALMVRRAVATDRIGWMAGAAVSCVVATFCFAAGVALFPTLLMLAWLLKARWRHIAVILVVMAMCLVMYLYALSGDDGVRASLKFRPLDSLVVAARWLASPWITGWLGFADPQTHEIVLDTSLGLAMKKSANILQNLLHLEWRSSGAMLIGLAGLAILSGSVIAKACRRGLLTPTRTLAFALMMFAAATAGLISVGRLDYLDLVPQEVFADRYLVWSCLFWMGIGLLLLSLANARRVWLRNGLLTFAFLLPIALMPLQRYGQGWGASVYQGNQASAAAAMSDLFDNRRFKTEDDATIDQRVHSYELLREGHLGPFRFAGTEDLGHVLTIEPIKKPDDISVHVEATITVVDARDASTGAAFDGVVDTGIRAVRSRGPLAVIDPDRRIVGYAMFSNVGKPMRPLSLSMPIKRGFDGYVKHFDPAVRYRLVSMDSDGIGGIAWILGELPALKQ